MNSHQRNSDPACQICYATNEETKQIISTLLQTLYKLKEERNNQDQIIENGGLGGLLKMVFLAKYKNFKETTKCSHKRITEEFLRVLEVTNETLHELANIKMMQKAKYNYHMDVIGSQIKTFHRHFTELTSSRHDRGKSGSKSPVRTEKTVSPPKKIEDFQPMMTLRENVKNQESERDQPIVYLPNFQMQQFNEALNNMFLMTYGSTQNFNPQQ